MARKIIVQGLPFNDGYREWTTRHEEERRKAKPRTNGKPRFYFAYGANTDIQGMKFRCPTAEAVGVGVLRNYKLAFRGCADIVTAPGEKVVGVVWIIQPSDEMALDRFEGYPHSYTKKMVPIKPSPEWGEEPIEAMVYVMTPERWRGYHRPSDHYFWTLVRGYEHFGIDTVQIDKADFEAAARDIEGNHRRGGGR